MCSGTPGFGILKGLELDFGRFWAPVCLGSLRNPKKNLGASREGFIASMLSDLKGLEL